MTANIDALRAMLNINREWYSIKRSELEALLQAAAELDGLKMIAAQSEEQRLKVITPLNEVAARQLYEAETANHPIIHCNRFPTWGELSEDSRNIYRSIANA